MKNFLVKVNAAIFFLFVCTLTLMSQSKPINLTFVDHLKAGMIEQDVFVEKVKGSGFVYRVTAEEREKYLDYEVYATKTMQEHDPLNRAKVGPYQKGQSLGITLRQWLSAKGAATYQCEDGWGVFKAEFENLVPNAVYTFWHSFMAKPPTTPSTGFLDLPMGDRDGSQSVFRTDENGKATYNIRFETCLQMTNNQLMGLVAIALHSDGETYGVLPGPFGKVTHVQLFTPLPEARDVEDDIVNNK